MNFIMIFRRQLNIVFLTNLIRNINFRPSIKQSSKSFLLARLLWVGGGLVRMFPIANKGMAKKGTLFYFVPLFCFVVLFCCC